MDDETFTLPSETFMPVELDTDMLGLKYELMDFLADHDFTWFEDYSDIESDMSHSEIKIYISCNPYRLYPVLWQFARANRFQRVFFSEDSGYFKLDKRKAA